jgi:hypothetical protein
MAEQLPFGQNPPTPPSPGFTSNMNMNMGQSHQKSQLDEQFVTLSRKVSDLLSRLRVLEERYANLRREHQATGQNMIENHQNLSKQQRKLSENSVALKRNLHELGEQISTMQGELVDVAKSHDLKVLERYLSFWEPSHFITREEAEKIIRETMTDSASRKFYKQASGGKD